MQQSHDSDLRKRFRHQPARQLHEGAITSPRRVIAHRPHAHKEQVITDIAVQVTDLQPGINSLTNPVVPTPSMPRSVAVHQANLPKRRTVQYSRAIRGDVPRKAMPEVPETHLQQTDTKTSFTYILTKYIGSTSKNVYVRIFGDQPLKKPQIAMLSAAGMVFIFGVAVSILGLRTNSHVEAQATNMSQQTAIVDPGDNPDETDPGAKAVGNYTVAPDLPKRISIPKTKTYSRIKPLGTKNDNELKAPANIYDTGWYQKSAKPGENGAMLLDGHVHGPKKPGVFANLKKLIPGDKITVERGDGQIFTYSVVKTQSYPVNAVDMTAALVSAEAGKQGLNIITCSGSLNAQKTGYEERLMVFAVRD